LDGSTFDPIDTVDDKGNYEHKTVNLKDASFVDYTYNNISFREANLTNTKFNENSGWFISFEGVKFDKAILKGTKFNPSTFKNCSFYNATNMGDNVSDVLNMAGCTLVGCDFSEAVFYGADFEDSTFHHINCFKEYGPCNFGNAKMPGTNLNCATMNGCNLRNADFSGSYRINGTIINCDETGTKW
jgi:uncharacterized protein YjbI with pentapeptide repeats